MDHVSRRIEQPTFSPVDDLAFFIHQYEVTRLDQAESNAEWVYPKRRWVDWIAHRDVSGDAFVEPIFSKDSESSYNGVSFILPVESGDTNVDLPASLPFRYARSL
jgi:hypothetical protein